jgi:tetratricopeptide (TPR) repeat protein
MKKLMICLMTIVLLVPILILANNDRVHGGNAMDYFNLGMKSSMAYKKIEYFTKALELDPNLAAAYEKRGLFYYFQGKYDKVIEDFSNYIKLVSDEADAYQMLGMAYLKFGNHDQAVRNFDRAIAIQPDMTAAYCYRSEAYRLKGYNQEALKDATRAIALNGDPRIIADAYKTRGMTYREMGQDDLSYSDLQKSFEINPRFVFYRYISSYASLEQMRTAGLFGLIGIAFVMIFGFRMKPPEKDQ